MTNHIKSRKQFLRAAKRAHGLRGDAQFKVECDDLFEKIRKYEDKQNLRRRSFWLKRQKPSVLRFYAEFSSELYILKLIHPWKN